MFCTMYGKGEKEGEVEDSCGSGISPATKVGRKGGWKNVRNRSRYELGSVSKQWHGSSSRDA